MHIEQFSQETQDYIHRLCYKAIMRAIKNGTYDAREWNEGSAEEEVANSDS